MRVVVQANFELFGVIKKEGGWYIAHCPPLDISTQGRTEAEARQNLIEASELFVVSCFERGTFEQAMRELGWQVATGGVVQQNQAQPEPLPEGGFSFPVPVPFARENARPCPA